MGKFKGISPWERPETHRNIKIHGELIIFNFHFPKIEELRFYDFGPNGNYWESLEALRVLSRMPASFPPRPPKHVPPSFGGISELHKIC